MIHFTHAQWSNLFNLLSPRYEHDNVVTPQTFTQFRTTKCVSEISKQISRTMGQLRIE